MQQFLLIQVGQCDGQSKGFYFDIVFNNRLTIAFFSISGLGLLKAVDFSESEKRMIIDWIYSLQVNQSHPGIGKLLSV